MHLDEIEQLLTTPNEITAFMPDVALLRIWHDYNFIEYPRSELKQVMDEMRQRILIWETGLEKPSASDRLLFILLRSFACDIDKK